MSGSYFMLQFLKKIRSKEQQKKNINENTIFQDSDLVRTTNNKCRLCLKEGDKPIYNSENSFNIVEAIRTFAGVSLNENDDYPKNLCMKCYTFLQQAVLFRRSAQNTDKQLRQSPAQDSGGESDTVNHPADDDDIEKPAQKSRYSCKLCKLNFKTSTDLIAHNRSRAHKRVRIRCPVCYRLLTAQLYQKHVARHQSASHLICDICGKLYRKDNLVRHLQLHSFELPFKCQICPYRGRFMESLKIHMRTHTGDKPFSCDKCELRFLTRSNLNRHLLTHKKERPFKCLECGRGFYTKRDMDLHFKADHAGLREFGCKMCGNKYGTRKALMRHELRVHKRDKMAKGRMPLYLQAGYQKQDDVMSSMLVAVKLLSDTATILS
ncbi:hypothetical protein PYW08_009757 [Mythimna loreyi]|uniref:Uncharacterized protein n=1 Tax=Mythimna loreyi TaxID=667449 RepID=A0ACC2Q8N3_9NEOP|nr:hypothetical protein PYW08_009757 [Mythimna loreyi]